MCLKPLQNQWFQAHAARERNRQNQKTGQIRIGGMFRSAASEATVFTVVSGADTGVVLADVPETTAKIVVSGTSGAEDTEAEENDEANQDT